MLKLPQISAIMIVKNEEEHLPRCLESIKDQVDEIVIVDTGSEDNSIEIAKRYGAKVFKHPWEDHFSKHRNQSVSYATGDWLFQIDADEELIIEGDKNLKDMARICDDVDSILVTLESRWDRNRRSLHNSIRFFKNIPSIRYKGRVHNEVIGMKTGKYMPIRLLHYGYDFDRTMQKRKFDRTVNLLLMDVKEDPENPRAHHYLGISYLSMNLNKEAAKHSEKAINLCIKQGNYSELYSGSYFVAATSHIKLGDVEKAEYFAKEAFKRYPLDLDSLFILSKIYFEKHDLELFFEYIDKFLERLRQLEESSENFGTYIFQTTGNKWLAHLYKACAWFDKGFEKKGHQELIVSLNSCPDKASFHHLLAGYYKQRKNLKKSESEFMNALHKSPERIEIMWDFAQLKQQKNDFQGAQELLERIIVLKPDHMEAHLELGNLNLKNNNFQNSLKRYERVLTIDETHLGAGINIALTLRKLGRYEESLGYSLKFLKAHPQSIEIHSNLAYSYYAQGDYKSATKHFVEMGRIDKDLVDPQIFLSQIFLMKGDLESLVGSCDNLLQILDMNRDYLIESLKDLGDRYFEISDKLQSENKSHLSNICTGIAKILSQAQAVSD